MPLASSLATASAPAWVGRVDALNAQGVALRRAGQAQAACAAYRQALALCPETEPARAAERHVGCGHASEANQRGRGQKNLFHVFPLSSR